MAWIYNQHKNQQGITIDRLGGYGELGDQEAKDDFQLCIWAISTKLEDSKKEDEFGPENTKV